MRDIIKNYLDGTEDKHSPTVPRKVLAKRLRDKADDPVVRLLSAIQLERDSIYISELRVMLYGEKSKVKALSEEVKDLKAILSVNAEQGNGEKNT